ncbi:MAG: RNA polymerase sigma factor [Candidatus Aminicenantales bacterium]
MDLNEVIRQCLKGQQGAWEMLVNTYSKRVFNLAYQFAGSFQEAEDLTQDIFLKLYGVLPRYDFERNFTAWLLTLAKNHLIDTYRRTKWEKSHRDEFDEHFPAPEAAHSPEIGLNQEADRKLIWESLNRLNAETRMAVILRDIQDKSYEEVADVMGLPLGTVKSRINRGRLQLAKFLKDRREEDHEM